MDMNNDVWNLWDVKPPPVCSVKTDLNFRGTGISNLKEVTYEAFKTLRDFGHLDKEAAILSRFLYKHKRIFRHDKGIQSLVKVNQCLKRYLKLKLDDLLFTFKQSLPQNINRTSTIAHLPTRQMLKWILLRLQAFAQLFSRVIDLTKATGAYIYKKLCLGWSLNLSLLIFCITARILTAAKFLVTKSIEWYDSFYKCLPHLQQTAEFLPNYNFPSDLKVWLGNVDLIPLKKKTLIDDVFQLIDLAKEEEEEKEEGEDESEVKIVNEIFIKTFLRTNLANVDSDIEEITGEAEKEVERGVKRPFERTIDKDEDLGVLVDDDDDDYNAEEQNTSHGWRQKKMFKKKKGSRRVKWLKKLKKV